MSQHKAVSQYLTTYAEPEIRSLPEISTTYAHCLVIPAFNETWENLRNVWRELSEKYLVILVVNAPDEGHSATLKLMKDVRSQASTQIRQGRCSYLQGKPDILLVDRCSAGNTIDSRYGVGLARKIGADIALTLIQDQVVLTNRISVTDADAILPANYLKFNLGNGDAALNFPFEHRTEIGAELSTLLYDISLLYYACGLDWANSQYAYTSLGSTIAISSDHYAMVRGFPRRSAAEDFYLLNKLAKTGKIRRTGNSPIILSGRLSDRVPVGTGPGIRKIQALGNPEADYLFYNPGIFRLLNEFQSALGCIWERPDAMESTCEEINHYCKVMQLDRFIPAQRQRQNKKPVFDKLLTDWFDGFKTLKFIHFMRDHFLPSVPFQALGEAAFIESAPIRDLAALRGQLYSRLFPDAAKRF